ncbi:hypothetical protein ASC96_23600 [Rhizobium sp. Root1204]|nr:hypothetical protein ASC96_23600 [Rhizobium sp. Root1204]
MFGRLLGKLHAGGYAGFDEQGREGGYGGRAFPIALGFAFAARGQFPQGGKRNPVLVLEIGVRLH